jgi:hypothetical protein
MVGVPGLQATQWRLASSCSRFIGAPPWGSLNPSGMSASSRGAGEGTSWGYPVAGRPGRLGHWEP